MEVGEENTSNNLQGSTATTLPNEGKLENDIINDSELGKQVLESSTEAKVEELSVVVPNLDDPNPFVTMAVGETAVEKEVIVQGGNLDSGGCWNSVTGESTNVLHHENDGDEGATKEIPTADVADDGEFEEDVVVRDASLKAVEESVMNDGDDTNTNASSAIKNDMDGGEGEMETLRTEEDVKVLKDGVEVDVPSLQVAEICEREEVMTDLKSDDCVDIVKENVQTVQGDGTITESQGVNAERVVADEDAAPGVGEGANEEEKMADEEKSFGVTEVDEEEHMVANEEKSLDTDLETDNEAAMADEEKAGTEGTELPESPVKSRSSGRKRKRGGKNSNPTPKSTGGARKKIEEDVCFICFDGGDLVLCDKRDCPKAYHPSCVNRDEAFFQTKGRWNCGWHLCSICEKKAEYMCYTCTFSLCKACIKTNVILCVRDKEKKGFCEACMKTLMLIEKNSQDDDQENVDFDDKSSWEYFFKDYWTDMKAKLNLSLTDLVEAKNAWKGFEPAGKQEPLSGHSDGGSGSENTSENQERKTRRRRNSKKHKTRASAAIASEGTTSVPENTEWASKELLEFVMHMGNDESYKSQFDVQALLLEYIKTNKLRDTRRKSQIICDARLQRLFGKPRVGHFEMLKLLESHFLIKEDDDIQGSVVNNEVILGDGDEATETGTRGGRDKKRKIRKKGEREPQSNREDYAAIDIHNINLIYVRRKLAEDLLDDTESFDSKIIGTVVRIRIPGANHKNDIYRLVPVKGTTKGAQYAVGKKMTDTMLEISNLNKREFISIDTISNQDFTEDECKRLRQSVKYGFTSRLTVGDILDKAIELQAARVNDWIETEVVRLSHLRDRASDLGRKKELRECVEKLQVLKTPEERARRLQDIPVIHDDPAMDPQHKSEEDTDENDKKQDMYRSSVGSRSSKRPDYHSTESWRGTGASTSRNAGKNFEFSRNLSSNSFSKKVEDAATSPRSEPRNEKVWDRGRDRNIQPPSILKKPSSANETETVVGSTKDVAEASPKVNETDKLWHYKDPTGKIQGPFSMAQLRKWNNSKFFPVDLRIWKKSENEDNGLLLTDALEGRFTPSVKIPKPAPDERHGFANLPSPTPNQSSGHVGPSLYHSSNDGLQSPTPNSTQLSTLLVAGGNTEPNIMVQSQMVQPIAGQNAYGWSGGPPQNPLPSPSSNVAGQQLLTYNQWGVQNPGGNFLQPSQPNVSWPTVNLNPNPNTGLVGPTPVNQTMNWGTGNVNSPWGLQAGQGWVSPQAAQGATPNQGWAAAPGSIQGPIVSGNGNPNWVGPPGNQGILPNTGEMASVGNQGPSWVGGATIQGSGPGSSNQSWGSPRPRNRSRWDEIGGVSGETSRGGEGSGFHGNRRSWDKPGSFNNRGRS